MLSKLNTTFLNKRISRKSQDYILNTISRKLESCVDTKKVDWGQQRECKLEMLSTRGQWWYEGCASSFLATMLIVQCSGSDFFFFEHFTF